MTQNFAAGGNAALSTTISGLTAEEVRAMSAEG